VGWWRAHSGRATDIHARIDRQRALQEKKNGQEACTTASAPITKNGGKYGGLVGEEQRKKSARMEGDINGWREKLFVQQMHGENIQIRTRNSNPATKTKNKRL